jgi:predicted phage-related endonuclease
MIIWHDVKQGSDAWKKLRAPLWTGSTAIRLLQSKTLLPDSDWDGNDATRRGSALEVAAIREYERKYRCKVQRPGFVTNTVYSNAGYSPDGIDRAWLLECKAFNGQRHEDLVAGKIPLTVQVQIFFGMIIAGKRKARLLAFNPENEVQLTIIEITYEKEIGDNIRRCLRADMKKRQLLA